MRKLSAANVLAVWESGSQLHSLDRSLLLLSAALPEVSPDELADWPLGHRNSALAKLHSQLFGNTLQGTIACPECGEKLEFTFDSRLLAKSEPGATTVITVDGRAFRLPTSRDISIAACESDARTATVRLLNLCCLEADSICEWSDDQIAEIGDQMAAADTLAETRMMFECAKCGISWDENLDISNFLWTEIDAEAKRTLLDVHTLAAAYGWTEDSVLALSDRRRKFYIEMVVR